MKDVKKITVQSANASREQQRYANGRRHKKKHKRNMSLYYLLVMTFVLLVGGILSVTVLFNIQKINVVGATNYDNNTIIASSKIKIGDNLVRLNTAKAEQSIYKELIYIESVKVNRKLPVGVDIVVEPAVPYANIQAQDGYYLISKQGRVLERAMQAPKEGLLAYQGYDPVDTKLGDVIASNDQQKQKLIVELTDAVAASGIADIKVVDITDRINITLRYQDRIDLAIGSASELAYKLKFAYVLLSTKIGVSERGTINLESGKSVSFIPESDKPAETTPPPAASSENTTGTAPNSGQVTSSAQ